METDDDTGRSIYEQLFFGSLQVFLVIVQLVTLVVFTK
jgi:hypothetical protein